MLWSDTLRTVTQVGRDVLAHQAVASGRPHRQRAVLVDQLHRHAVELRFDEVLDVLVAEQLADPRVELRHLLRGGDVRQRQHLVRVPNRFEAALRAGADPLGW